MAAGRGLMAVKVHVPTPPEIPPDHHTPQQHQKRGDQQLRGGPEPLRHLDPEGDYEDDDESHSSGMAQAPDQTQPSGSPHPGAGPGGQGRDGRKMVWLKGMAQAQQATYGENGYNRRRHSRPKSNYNLLARLHIQHRACPDRCSRTL